MTLTHGSPPEEKDNAALMELSQTQFKTQLYCREEKNRLGSKTDDLCCLSTVRNFLLRNGLTDSR